MNTKTKNKNKNKQDLHRSRVRWDENAIDLNLWVLLHLHIWNDLFKIGYKDEETHKKKETYSSDGVSRRWRRRIREKRDYLHSKT